MKDTPSRRAQEDLGTGRPEGLPLPGGPRGSMAGGSPLLLSNPFNEQAIILVITLVGRPTIMPKTFTHWQLFMLQTHSISTRIYIYINSDITGASFYVKENGDKILVFLVED